MAKPRTLFDKIWASHVVRTEEDGTALIYIDLHLAHEVTSPQAFAGLREAGRGELGPQGALGDDAREGFEECGVRGEDVEAVVEEEVVGDITCVVVYFQHYQVPEEQQHPGNRAAPPWK